jgi:hypothetical protein
MAINIQRGRDHGLPDYNTAREVYGLARINNTDHFKNVHLEVRYATCRALQFSTNMQNENFCTTSHTAHNNILVNRLILLLCLHENCIKTHFMHFSYKLNNNINLSINYNNNHISNTQSIKFLELVLDTNITWRNHIGYLHTKLGSGNYAIRILKSFMPLTTLTNINFSYFHSIMSYGIIFWGNSTHSHSVFKLQKKVIR